MSKRNEDVEDSSSSEDEVTKSVLREATNHEFFKDVHLFEKKPDDTRISQQKQSQNSVKRSEDLAKPKSLRRDLEQTERFKNFGVTPSFQEYVARKLDEMIEKSIEFVDTKDDNSVVTATENTNNGSGIKLFSSSVEFLSVEEEPEKLPKKRKVKVTIDEAATMLKCKEVAVDAERILSKSDTKAWTSKRGEPEFKYKKLKNGTLVEKT
ncbi:uncharacterized protein LOC117224156 [Megalopta genalis]|uniref:uncharacterized protein LOC117224156 n=1 Tax=Megalopta genalis TaxID=115081 RepID=UPI003FD1A7AF